MAVAICGAGIVDLRSTNTVMAIAKKYAAATYAAYGGRVRVIKAAESALVIRLAGTSRLAVATAESRERANTRSRGGRGRPDLPNLRSRDGRGV